MLSIVAALKMEIAAFSEALIVSSMVRLPNGGTVTGGRLDGQEAELVVVGVGPLRAAQAVAEWMQCSRPCRVLVVGTAGALDDRISIGDVVVGSGALFDSQMVSDLLRCRPNSGRLHFGQIVSRAIPLFDEEERARVRRHYRAMAVDMETTTIARSMKERGYPCAALRWITDIAVDAPTRREMRNRTRRASDELLVLVRGYLKQT